ncbi:Exodeoxyribonuclease I [Candidatus Ecksteinia adelgidicola]|nr:Exodeoxyribonuclease I [Candidatus Ecksteinia adelgidicola]
MHKKIISTFYVYDYETFGKKPSIDRPAQFAGIRTDMDFNIVEEPLVFYCAPSDDYLPEPEAVIIHGITPQKAHNIGINEAEFAKNIYRVFNVPGTCILGYNNIRFDDEVSRNIFYRTFYDPYIYSWKNGNSRWDLLNVMRACYALRPNGIIWPKNEKGLPSFKLEDLSYINNVQYKKSHDAMSDVYSTIAMAKLLKTKQPQLFNFFFQYRSKKKLNTLINFNKMTPLIHVSSTYGACRGNTSLVSPLAWHPKNKNAIIMCDLFNNIEPFLTLNIEQLREQLYTRYKNFSSYSFPIPFQIVKMNQCPILSPKNTLLQENAIRLGINYKVCLKNLKLLYKYPNLKTKIISIFSEENNFFQTSDNVDCQLYNNFFSNKDKTIMKIIQNTKPQNLSALNLVFNDIRMKELFFRFQARNYPSTLNNTEQQRWLKHRQAVLNKEKIKKYFKKLEILHDLYKHDKKNILLIQSLFEYAHSLVNSL